MRILVLLMVMGMNVAKASDPVKGETLYQANCSACHGKEADGNGPAGSALNPPPVGFTNAAWWEGKDDKSVEANIKNGKPGTAMMGFAHISSEDIEHMVAYLRTKQPAQ